MGLAFNADSRAATRCHLIRNSDNAKLTLQFNPTGLQYDRSATYNSIDSPGMAYPLTQFVGGNVREFQIEVFYYDKPHTGKITKARKFFLSLLPPQKNKKSFVKPPTFDFVYGYFHNKCVLTNLGIDVQWLDEKGREIMTTFTLSVRQVSL